MADESEVFKPKSYGEQNWKTIEKRQEIKEPSESTKPVGTGGKQGSNQYQTRSAHSPVSRELLPQNDAQYASDQASMRPESTKRESLYDETAVKAGPSRFLTEAEILARGDRVLAAQALAQALKTMASKGGVSDATGNPNANLDGGMAASDPQPNAQRVLNGSRLGTEDDSLTKDQENYGTGSNMDRGAGTSTPRPSRSVLPLLYDTDTSSSYARETNVNRNTTARDPEHIWDVSQLTTGAVHRLTATSTVDNEPDVGGGINMTGEEGSRHTCPGTITCTAAVQRLAKDVHDGDFDPAGRATGDRMITNDPKNTGYLNVHSSEVDADADPRLWNMANQPMGQAG